MLYNFKPGDKLRCIQDWCINDPWGIKKGNIYTYNKHNSLDEYDEDYSFPEQYMEKLKIKKKLKVKDLLKEM